MPKTDVVSIVEKRKFGVQAAHKGILHQRNMQYAIRDMQYATSDTAVH